MRPFRVDFCGSELPCRPSPSRGYQRPRTPSERSWQVREAGEHVPVRCQGLLQRNQSEWQEHPELGVPCRRVRNDAGSRNPGLRCRGRRCRFSRPDLRSVSWVRGSGRGTSIAPGHDSVPRRVAYRPSWRDHFRFHWAAVPESHMTVLREDWKKFPRDDQETPFPLASEIDIH